MTETQLTRELLKLLRNELPSFVIQKHADRFTLGIPDFSATGKGMTSWWEIKLAKPKIHSPGIQLLTAQRLAAAGICYYIVYTDLGAGCLRTCIYRPNDVPSGKPEAEASGFDHYFVLDFIKKVHA